jgi:hypothetical protein
MSILDDLIKEQMESMVKAPSYYPSFTRITSIEMMALRQELIADGLLKPDQALTHLRGSFLIVSEFDRFS